MHMIWQKRIDSFRYAFKGLADLFRHEPNARVHAVAGVCALSAGFYFQISRPEWTIIVLSIAIVLSLEAANTALERLTDLVSPEHHPLAGRAKDVAAAAVLIAATGAAIVGAIIFLPKIACVWSAK